VKFLKYLKAQETALFLLAVILLIDFFRASPHLSAVQAIPLKKGILSN
jgi:hypothetical protein